VALNKVDLLGPAARRRAVGALSARYPGAVAISAMNHTGFQELLEAIEKASRGEVVKLDILVPYGRESVLADLRRIGGVEHTEYVESGTRASGWVPSHAARRFEPYQAAAPKVRRTRARLSGRA
jgi:GTP-binding protein HflX